MSLEKGHNGCNEAGLLACSFRDSTQSIFKAGPLLNYLFLSVSVTTDTEYKLTTASKQSTHSQQSPSATFLGPVVSLKTEKKLREIQTVLPHVWLSAWHRPGVGLFVFLL